MEKPAKILGGLFLVYYGNGCQILCPPQLQTERVMLIQLPTLASRSDGHLCLAYFLTRSPL